MKLGALRRHWNRLGRRDPLWAVLTDPLKRDGGWRLEDFFREGAAEVAAVLARSTRMGVAVSRRRALDFGCGVGRITQALGDHFERCDGVDISTAMLKTARRHNRHGNRCTYHLNTTTDLGRFETACFSFVYSTLVLQHMEPQYSRAYIGELLRVLEPGGLLVFQLPSHRTTQAPSTAASRTAVTGRLPAGACRAGLTIDAASLSLPAGQEVALPVRVENRSPHAWPSLPDARGWYRINVANHWLDADGDLIQRDDARCPLPHDLAPDAAVELMLGVTAPPFDGAYRLELDLVQENVGWFGDRGSTTLRVPCQVSGGLPAPPRAPREVAAAAPPEPLFRDRHPRTFAVLRATGIRDVYWAWRRGLDGVKRQRDRAIIGMRTRVYDPLVPPVINWWNGRPFAARMEMHCVPRADVETVVGEHHGRVVAVDEELMPGGYQSLRFWVVKK